MKTERDKIIEVLKAELFPMQLVDDSDPIEIIGFDKAADRILAIQQEGARERYNEALAYYKEHMVVGNSGRLQQALRIAAGLDDPTK